MTQGEEEWLNMVTITSCDTTRRHDTRELWVEFWEGGKIGKGRRNDE